MKVLIYQNLILMFYSGEINKAETLIPKQLFEINFFKYDLNECLIYLKEKKWIYYFILKNQLFKIDLKI